MILTSAAVLLIIFTLVALAARWVSLRRHRAAAEAAVEPVVVDGQSVDAADLIWSVTQATHAPTMQAISSSFFGSAERVVDVASATVDALPPDQRLDLITTRARLQQTREARETLADTADSLAATAGPAVTDALIVAISEALGTSVLVQGAAALTSNLVETLLPHQTVGGLLDQLPGAERVMDVVSSTVGDGVGTAVGAIVDSHIPVVTIIVAIHRANRSRENGLDAERVEENLAWDIGAKGGSIVGGAAIGTAMLPVVGTVIGALIGAAVGTGVAHLGKHRHLAEARRQLVASVEALGLSVDNRTLLQILNESERMLSIKRQRYRDVASEAADMAANLGWRKRVFQPTVGGKIAEHVVQLAGADIICDETLHNALRRTIARAGGSAPASVYLWTAGQHLMGWQTFIGPDTSEVKAGINFVEDEQKNLVLGR